MSTLPASALPDVSALNARPMPGRTYKLDLSSKRIVGYVDGLDAVLQAVMKILYTERYAWVIYDWDYGTELEKYLGQEFDFVMGDLQREMEESLLVDDRVMSIENFTMNKTSVDALEVSFTVQSTTGPIAVNREVRI